MSERKTPFSVDAFQKMIERLAQPAGLTSLKPHPHMLRHAWSQACQRGLDNALVVFRGDGEAAIDVGRTIKARGFATAATDLVFLPRTGGRTRTF